MVDRHYQIETLAGFLNVIDFSHFATFTTRKPISLASTRRIAETVGTHIDAGNRSSYFWAAEKFDVRDGFHFHALIAFGPNQLHQIDLWGWYFERYGRVDIINNTEHERRHAASWYCSKYITKRLADYDLYFAKNVQTRTLQTKIFN